MSNHQSAPPRCNWNMYHSYVRILLISLAIITLCVTPAASASPDRLNLVPLPAKYSIGDTVVCLSHDFAIKFEGPVSRDLQNAVTGAEANIKRSKHRFLSPTHGTEFFKKSGCVREISSLIVTTLVNGSIMDNAVKPIEERADTEGYNLTIPVSGVAYLSANTALGAFRGLATFESVFFKAQVLMGSEQYDPQLPLAFGTELRSYAPFAPYDIHDWPAFAWRSFMLDTSRHYFSIGSLKKLLDAMAFVKLNVFHWHITDANAWPLVLDDFPELATQGAIDQEAVYTEQDVKCITQYAGERGIDVVLEVDTPGHSASIALSHPDYIACHDRRPYEPWANQPPSGQLRYADSEVQDFTAKIYRGAMPLTRSRYFATGGDELSRRCMLEDKPTTDILKAKGWSLDDALDEFTKRTHRTLLDKGVTPVVWQEMVLTQGSVSALDKSTIVKVWIDSSDVHAVLDKGFRLVHASSDYFYLDCGQGGWVNGANSWCEPFKTWQRMYSFDPLINMSLTQRALILGGQASLWTEQTDESNLEPQVWPRAAAAADLWWTGDSHESYPRDWIKALGRMHDIRYRLVDRGVRAIPLQDEWCARNPLTCVLNG